MVLLQFSILYRWIFLFNKIKKLLCYTTSYPKWLSIIPKIDVQKWLSIASNLVTQRYNWWNSHCQFHKDKIHEIVNFIYTSYLQQPVYKLLTRILILSYLYKTFTQYQDKMENQCIAWCSFLVENYKLEGDLSCEVVASIFSL